MSGRLSFFLVALCGCAALAGEGADRPKPEAAPVKVISWNIQYGSEGGSDPNSWPQRKEALRAALESAKPDILCTQEALDGQVEFLAKVVASHGHAGVGRDDGKKQGEHCAIFYDQKRFELLDGGTFWLSDTPDQPGRAWGEEYNRICTWVRLKEQASGGAFFVFNTHFPLKAEAREKAAGLLVERLQARKPAEPVILAGDFNCGPDSPPWKTIEAAGLVNSAKAAGSSPGAATYHKSGFPLICIDGIFASAEWVAKKHEVVTGALKGAYPSDHFGASAVLEAKLPGKPGKD